MKYEQKFPLFIKKLEAFLKSDGGATSAEYAIMASLIAAVIVLAVTAFGVAVNDLFEAVQIP